MTSDIEKCVAVQFFVTQAKDFISPSIISVLVVPCYFKVKNF